MTFRDANGQPGAGFRVGANRQRALNTLFGICRGLVADQRLNEREVAYLNSWLNEYEPLLAHDGDGYDLVHDVRGYLADGRLTHDELESLKEQLESVADNRGQSRFICDDVAMHHLTGLVHGMVADGRINDAEVTALSDWMNRHLHLEPLWPASTIFRRLRGVLADGVITEAERLDLYDTLTALVGGSLEETGTVGGLSTRLLGEDMTDSPIVFEGRSFLFTGKFIFGRRNSCEEAVLARGGAIAAGVSHSTDYLIVGALSSRDWVNESYGRKIEAAMALRQKGHGIAIHQEEFWTSCL